MRILVSGCTKTVRDLARRWPDNLGSLLTPATGNSVRSAVQLGLPWGVDNAAFSSFDPVAFCRRAADAAGKPGLLWVVVPDVVADAKETLAKFRVWGPVLSELGLPLAFVGQDRAEDIDIPWDRFCCWFIGGSTAWKTSCTSGDLATEAKRRGKLIHMGRCNTPGRFQAALDLGCDSVDGGQFAMYGETYLESYLRLIAGERLQRVIA